MKPNTLASSIGTKDIKCFKCFGRGHIASECPTRRTMLVKEDGEITSESSASEWEKEKEIEEEELEDDLLMVRRLLGSHMQPLEQSQSENIFHTRCLINGKLWCLIIDGKYCTNMVNSKLVSKLNLETKSNPRPYKLHWLWKDVEMTVSQCWIEWPQNN